MKLAVNIVNTYAWMNATSNSRQFMKMQKRTLTAVMEAHMPAPIFAVTNTTLVRARMMMCPAMMLAKRRTVNEKGLVKTPMNSMVGIMGRGAFKKMGTSGQKMLL